MSIMLYYQQCSSILWLQLFSLLYLILGGKNSYKLPFIAQADLQLSQQSPLCA